MLSFMRMLRGTFHMMFCRLNWSSQAIVIAPTKPSDRPAVWSVRRPPPKKNAMGIIVSPHLDARDRVGPGLPRRLERGDRLAEAFHGRLEALRVARVPDHRDDRRGLVERFEHRVVVLVQPVELRLLDPDRRAQAGISAFRVADLRLEALDREDRVPDRLQALDLAVHRHAVADVQLDLLQESSVLFDAVTDVGHGVCSPGGFAQYVPAYRFLRMYLGLWMEIHGSPATHHRAKLGRSPSITWPECPSMRMNIALPLWAYSMNQTGACSSSPSYVVG